MPRLYAIIILVSITLIIKAQTKSDTLYLDIDYAKDTTKTFHFGFIVGSVYQGLVYKANTSNYVNDSININGTTPQGGFCVGVILEKDFGEKIWLRSGLLLNISKLNLQYNYKNIQENYTFSYSTLEIPIWIQYALRNKRKGLSWGGGIKGTIDISKKSDKLLRNFSFNNYELMLGTGPSMRWKLPSHSLINAQLAFNISIHNIFAKTDNIYSRAINSGQRWQIQLLLSMN